MLGTSSKSRQPGRSLNFYRTRILGYSRRFGFGRGFPANFAPLLRGTDQHLL
jgi:hypothetical protein